ncbi:uncharacterized protein LOC119553616 isoform X2 [Drosophila subpulchrella]|uniref:uncharacterized protein LOC119553616 isoform X2 n=1 Tax=Drosophila subpulchrella TaxID=1486046 RepID=UPI0018A19645|nr:uncharacterized protein LOC119553616 isoform X2 [Drosophila subpulchrella]
MRCAVKNCGNNNRNSNRRKWRFFHFPKDGTHLQNWMDFCQRDSINPATACICNEHFAPGDFERNMQYELGFSRKNPTKLKPGSLPSLNRPQKLAKDKAGRTKKDSKNDEPQSPHSHETIEIQLCNFTTDFVDLEESSFSDYNEVVELIRTPQRSPSSQPSKNADTSQHHRHLEVEILDPLNPQSNAKDHVEIIDSDGDNYVKHLEHEVSSLKREVFFLKSERKKLIVEIQNLKALIPRS